MEFTGFTSNDFKIFTIDGLENRMEAIISDIRPKLEALGEHFSVSLSALTGEEMFPHVAKHARRSVNPPNDTWVAFANNKRGYKKHPHFQIGLWETHLFVWFAVIYEAPIKSEYGQELEKKEQEIRKIIPSSFVWSGDHTKPDAKAFSSMSDEEFHSLVKRLQSVKKAEILCGIHLDQDEVVNMSGSELIQKIESTFKTLLPLYKLS
ncbi:YktB family protein [Bacillus seohaeanensis]|jgi:uncharacterized protein YktB (UPF0637 family)|uniref:UPF0637 protein ACFSUL_03835 n=1 Tax=Bacillus seohaeanensis TaxID=284580 RepID=A0ABW5RN41_9BACI